MPGREDIKWQELLSHFRSVQAKHEKSRRVSQGLTDGSSTAFGSGTGPSTGGTILSGFMTASEKTMALSTGSPTRPLVRRKVTNTGGGSGDMTVRAPSGSLGPVLGSGGVGMSLLNAGGPSPLNPSLNTSTGPPAVALMGGKGKANGLLVNALSIGTSKDGARQNLQQTPGQQPPQQRRTFSLNPAKT